jgi:hypothetical protein
MCNHHQSGFFTKSAIHPEAVVFTENTSIVKSIVFAENTPIAKATVFAENASTVKRAPIAEILQQIVIASRATTDSIDNRQSIELFLCVHFHHNFSFRC